jgi:hypothetical protein
VGLDSGGFCVINKKRGKDSGLDGGNFLQCGLKITGGGVFGGGVEMGNRGGPRLQQMAIITDGYCNPRRISTMIARAISFFVVFIASWTDSDLKAQMPT